MNCCLNMWQGQAQAWRVTRAKRPQGASSIHGFSYRLIPARMDATKANTDRALASR
jgi:hypothetical protein